MVDSLNPIRDWILDGGDPPSISYRLITALRLFHIHSDGSDDDSLQRWRDTLTGVRDLISDANEGAWKKTVSEMCLRVMERARDARTVDALNAWIPGAVGMLWDEEYRVAHKVHEFIT
jgi:hypothetical protein